MQCRSTHRHGAKKGNSMLNENSTISPSPKSTDPKSVLEFQATKLIAEIGDLLDNYAGELVKAQTGFDYIFDVDKAKDALIVAIGEFIFQGYISEPDECVKGHQCSIHHAADFFGLDFDRHCNLIVPDDWDESDQKII